MQDSYSFTYKGHTIEIVYSGAPGWYDFYVDGNPRGCARTANVFPRAQEVIDLKMGGAL